MGHDPIDEGNSVVIEGHHPFGIELSQWDFQPCALAGDFVDAVEFEFDELTDTQSGRPLQQQRVSRQPVWPGLQCLSQPPIQVRGEVARQSSRQLRNVGAEYQPPRWCT